MKVILLENVSKVGNKYEVVDVKPGFAQNFLIPQKKAQCASPSALSQIERLQESIKAEEEARTRALTEKLGSVDGTTLTFTLPASEEGTLFASLSGEEILEVLNSEHSTDFLLDNLSIDHIKEVGDHEVTVSVGDATAKVTVSVTRDEA